MTETITMTPEEFAASVSPGTITGFLIDVYKETAQVVTVERSPDAYCRILDCDILEIVERRIGARKGQSHVFTIICDDEALNKEPQKISAIDNEGSVTMCGNLFIVKDTCNEHGAPAVSSLGRPDIEYLKRFIRRQATRKFPKPYPMLCQCEYC